MTDAPVESRYRALVADGRLEADPAQVELVERLDALAARLAGYKPGRRGGALSRLFGAKAEEAPRGLYLHGAVGRGKTMLMDLFFDAAPLAAKRRVHFHAFMAEVHARIHRWRRLRKVGEVSGDDPIAPVAAALASEAQLLCFDEFGVRDIADAMILGRLFAALFAAGVVMVATSNVAPQELYKDGLNRALFLPFVRLIGERLDVVELKARAEAALDKAFLNLAGAPRGAPTEIALLGRALVVPQAADGVARFSFDDLCRRPLGAPDFLALAERFHAIVVDRIPRLAAGERDAARRFITLVDALYDMKVKLIASADAEPDALYRAAEGAEAREFARCASRLIEMRSHDYLAEPHGGAQDLASGDLGGLIET